MYKRIYFLFGLIFLVLLAAIYLHRKSLAELDKSMTYVEHTHEVVEALGEISGDLKSVNLHLAAFITTQDNHLLANDFVDLITDLNQLKPIIFDKNQEQRVDTLSFMINDWKQLLLNADGNELNNATLQNKIKKDQ